MYVICCLQEWMSHDLHILNPCAYADPNAVDGSAEQHEAKMNSNI